MILSCNSRTRLLVLRKRRGATVQIQAFRRAQILLAMLHKYHFVVAMQKWYRRKQNGCLCEIQSMPGTCSSLVSCSQAFECVGDRNYIIVLQQFTRKLSRP